MHLLHHVLLLVNLVKRKWERLEVCLLSTIESGKGWRCVYCQQLKVGKAGGVSTVNN